MHSYIWYSIPALVNFSLFLSGLQRTLEVDTVWDRLWGLAFVLLALTGSALALSLIRCTWIKSLMPEQVNLCIRNYYTCCTALTSAMAKVCHAFFVARVAMQ